MRPQAPEVTLPITRLVDDIESSRLEFLAAVQRLAPQAVTAPVAEGRWSPLEYLEHLVRAEEVTVWRMFKAVEDTRTSGVVTRSPTPEAPIEEIVDRTWDVKEKAPPLAVPSLGGTPIYWYERLLRNRTLVAAFAAFVDEGDLDTVAYPHPISGPFTMRQGLEFIRFHLDRHRNHVLEASPEPTGG